MGNTESTQKLGERVLATKAKLEKDIETHSQRYEYLKTHSPETLHAMIENVANSFQCYSPFIESSVSIAWMHDAQKCKNIVLDSCTKVLSAPITKEEHEWFKKYVFEMNIWMFNTPNGDKFMFEELMNIARMMSSYVIQSMDSIYNHLKLHPKWEELMKITNQTLISRQDHPCVALLKEKGITNIFESKSDEEEAENMKSYIDSNLAINILSNAATMINGEFQNHIKRVMSHYGDFGRGPMKKVERSVSKLENDYQDAQYPKSAKLLDLVRCSVTFITVDQLIVGYHALMKHISNNNGIIELSRVKNGFLNDAQHNGGYRDIKVNVVYKSQLNPNLNMICEIQLLLIQYLHEKKRIHKLYSIEREETYFEMVVAADLQRSRSVKSLDKDIRDLQFNPVLNVRKEVSMNYSKKSMYKCSVNSELGLLGMEGTNWFGIVDIKEKKALVEMERVTGNFACHTHQWLTINQQNYVSVQMNQTEIKMFKVINDTFIEDEKYKITHSNSNETYPIINFCEFDRDFENVFLVTDYTVLQKRSINDINNIRRSIALKAEIESSDYHNFRLSGDGRLCGLGGGHRRKDFYVIDIEKEEQHEFISKALNNTYVPCFINGENEYICVGGAAGTVEIWNIEKKESIKKLQTNAHSIITSSESINNILAIGSKDKKLRLYDVRSWECFYTKQYNAKGISLHLTDDLKYVTYAGTGGDQCFVMQIE